MQELIEYTKPFYHNFEYFIQSNIAYSINFIKTSDEQTLILLNLVMCLFCSGCLNLYSSLLLGFNNWNVFQLIIYYMVSFILGFILGVINSIFFIIIKRSDVQIDWLISIEELRQQNVPIAVDVSRIHEHTE